MNLARSGELACKVQNETRSLRTLGRTVSVAVIVADASLSYGVCGTAMPSLLGGVVLLLSPPELLSFFFYTPVRNTMHRPSCRRERCVRVHVFAVTPASCPPVRGTEKNIDCNCKKKRGKMASNQ